MASNRQERLQMRQRGAGTRKIQAVDFGFSFGSPTGSAPAPSITQQIESVSGSTNVAETTVDKTTLPDATAPTTTEPSRDSRDSPTITLRNATTRTESPRRSVRLSLERVSTPNTTAEQEEHRSSKRRRISTKNDDLARPATTHSAAIATSSPLAVREENTQADETTGVDAGEELPETSIQDGAPDGGLPEVAVEQEAEEQVISQISRKGRPKPADSQTNEVSNPKEPANQASRRSIRQNGAHGSDPPERDISDQERQRPSRTSRRGLQNQSTAEIELEDREAEEESVPDATSTRRRRRRAEPGQSQPEAEQEDQQNEPTKKAPRGRRKRARLSTEDRVELEEPREDVETARTRSKRKGKNRAVELDERLSDEPQERAEETGKPSENNPRRRQPKEADKPTRRRGRPSLGEEDQPDAETQAQAAETRPEARAEPAQNAKPRRGRPSAGTENTTTNKQRTKRRREQDGEQEPRRREGTVAITVHRLANPHLLQSTHAASEPSDEEQDSADELEGVSKQFPSRSGVNAADVLSQICKEILDKHLATLDGNIVSDAANQAKRSEYARQRKAIEAYGTQLEGRLFELSELLDSNFSLGVQLKKAKREAAEMRKRLLEVRQQRHEITLRMDAVRRNHGEEEDAKMSRNAINNTLHNLDLMLDRNRNMAVEDDATNEGSSVAGLEFLLRSVSENVSSAAEGSHGGLLSQVRAFNAQLEMTARKLER